LAFTGWYAKGSSYLYNYCDARAAVSGIFKNLRRYRFTVIYGSFWLTERDPSMKRILIVLLIVLLSGAIYPATAQSASTAIPEPQDPNRLVVFEAFMNPA
jgi:hypothetical protein